MLLKRQLRLDHFLNHQSVPDGVTPGWPLGQNVDRVQVQLHRRKMHLANPSRYQTTPPPHFRGAPRRSREPLTL